jgi:murein L,D-transpeptidase YcbB/YkuD
MCLEFHLRISPLLASAAALALLACSNNAPDTGNSSASAASASQVSDKDLEDQVMAALADATKHGLTKDLFIKGDLPSEHGQRRQQLMQVAKDYASALADGKVDPTKIREVYTVPRPKIDVSAGLQQALSQKNYAEWVNSLAPQTPEYQALSEAFVALVKRSPGLPDTDIPAGDVIHPGDSDPRVPAIVRNLQAQGYLPAATDKKQEQAQASATTYTPAIANAVKRWQADSGLKVDGVIGSNTIAALNASPRDRARQIAVAMERLRWLDRKPPATRIDVNTAATVLDYYRDGRIADHRKVIAGQPGWETPQLGAPMYALVANPNWVVPESIVKEEIAEKSSSWLRENNFVRKDGKWVQQPGPQSALGLVKFAMKDDQAIYLHDTPAKSLFGQADRHDSHGCVRVENAVQFAQMLAQADGIDAKFSQAMGKKDEIQVDLNTDIPVRLMYHTAYLGTDGRIHFAQDAYGWDNDVATALGYPTKAPAQVKDRDADIGP